MEKSIVGDISPVAVNLEEGKEYYYCACGRSSDKAFCDGSHKVTSITPKAFTAEMSGEAYICRCKNSSNAPFCDGSHQKFSAEDIGK